MSFSNNDLKMFSAAVEAAKTGTFGSIRIGAVIVYKNKIIATGANSLKTHPLQQYHNRKRFSKEEYQIAKHMMHAEIDALRRAKQAKRDLTGCSIYIARIIKDKYGMCRPCPACIGALTASGITDVYYTTPDGLVYESISVC